MLKTAIVGASGYGGGELIRFLDAHPEFDPVHLIAHSKAGQALGAVHPHLAGGDRMLEVLDIDALADCDAVFLALPHGASSEPAMRLEDTDVRIFDLGSDFRMNTPERYLDAYGVPHPYPDQLGSWVYGLPELFGGALPGATRVAIPGCYPTSAILPLGPLVAAGLVSGSGVIVDSMSGVSGAGRNASDALHYGVIDESVKAYKLLSHRHQPEMEQALEALGSAPASLIFTPHLVPMQRGILSTVYAPVAEGVTADAIIDQLADAYAGLAFVSVIDAPPETRWVVGSNNAIISARVDERSGTALLLCAIDNLVKGAAGQAVQAANVSYGFPEDTGLPSTGFMP